MPIEFPFDIIGMVIKGIAIGVIASAPMGPVGILCIQRTLNKGRWYGFVTGIGAALSDILYALMAGFGMSFVMDLITQPSNRFWLQILGSAILLFFGIYSFFNNPMRNMHKSGNQKGTLLYNGLTAFAITFSNPLIIFLFLASFAQFAFIMPDRPIEMVIGFMSIIGGALLWWFGLTWLVDKIRARFDYNGIIIINKIIGSLVILFSLIILFGTIFNLYSIQV